jgi:hypothetical protein
MQVNGWNKVRFSILVAFGGRLGVSSGCGRATFIGLVNRLLIARVCLVRPTRRDDVGTPDRRTTGRD